MMMLRYNNIQKLGLNKFISRSIFNYKNPTNLSENEDKLKKLESNK